MMVYIIILWLTLHPTPPTTKATVQDKAHTRFATRRNALPQLPPSAQPKALHFWRTHFQKSVLTMQKKAKNIHFCIDIIAKKLYYVCIKHERIPPR